ncbi:probable plastid-lipid-associated protein 4, chloroplastic isoform X2 [Morus notabilis]|uniref:probable plastid-lipid-associated protein 4, chloroplastic isoform X2 n=1 Tax=Morus notabilis TaxID=981085 RepID=UPI000CED4C3E|nr:probable plastid-lipid-associated protein 4, chloroplastic isoform X2 [Morus notabilis]
MALTPTTVAITSGIDTHHLFPKILSNFYSPSISFLKSKPNFLSSIPLKLNNNKFSNNNEVLIAESFKWRTQVSFFSGFLTKPKNDIQSLKQELYDTIAPPLDRGAGATPEDQDRVEQIARKLEKLNKIKNPLKSNLLNGKWELLYTTSKSLLQTQRPKFLRPNGKIYQAINVDTLRAQNMETWPFFNQATANLVPLNSRRVAVKFDSFKIASLISCGVLGTFSVHNRLTIFRRKIYEPGICLFSWRL